ncbi:MAG: hypothetical protein Q7S43_03030 [bacterium]|nr:hypothetical protein [bacterium]MDO8496402.1 hypothetical protein [bacterium]
MDDDDFGPDRTDKLFNELDRLVDFAQGSMERENNPDKKFDVGLKLMNLMLEEVPENSKIYQQMGESWVAEVKYHGITFICIVGKRKPQFWDEVFEE